MSGAILAVDDSPSIRVAVRLALTAAGYTVTEAVDGMDGLDKARSQRFDMILTDLNMPNLDGLGMIRQIRQMPNQSGVPIIFLTTESDDSMKAQGKAAGATGWLVKPFQAPQLVQIARKVIAA